MSQNDTNLELPTPKLDPIEAEQTRLAELIFKRAPHMTAEYCVLLQHTGGLVSQSMTYAYNKGLQDAIKLILKESKTNVQKDQNPIA